MVCLCILKSRDITLPTKICIVKALVFPVVMYGCESWTIKKAEHWRIDAFELQCWRRLLRIPWTARRSNQSILKEISPGCLLSWSLKRANEPGRVPRRRIYKCKGPEVLKSLLCLRRQRRPTWSAHILREELGWRSASLHSGWPLTWTNCEMLWQSCSPSKSSFWNGETILSLPTCLFENSVS